MRIKAINIKKHKSVMGYYLPAPRFTPAAYGLLLRYCIIPLLLGLLLLDIMLGSLFYYGFGLCYGVLCLL